MVFSFLKKNFGHIMQHACILSHFSPVLFFEALWTVAHQAPLSMGILQARILKWASVPFSRGSSWPRDWTQVSYASSTGRCSLPPAQPGKPTNTWVVMAKYSTSNFWELTSGCPRWPGISSSALHTLTSYTSKNKTKWGGPAVKISPTNAEGCGFDPWLGN